MDFTPFHKLPSRSSKKGILKIKPLPREKAAIIKLTNLGYSINQLSAVFGRSTSYVHRIVRNAIKYRISRFVDKRKLVSAIRLSCAVKRRKSLDRWLNLWMPFIFGEVDKPP
jgi:AraC-like DNA-binding protein